MLRHHSLQGDVSYHEADQKLSGNAPTSSW